MKKCICSSTCMFVRHPCLKIEGDNHSRFQEDVRRGNEEQTACALCPSVTAAFLYRSLGPPDRSSGPRTPEDLITFFFFYFYIYKQLNNSEPLPLSRQDWQQSEECLRLSRSFFWNSPKLFPSLHLVVLTLLTVSHPSSFYIFISPDSLQSHWAVMYELC